MAKMKERIERAVLEAAEDYVGTGRLHKTVTEAGVKRKISYSNGEVRCSTSICERVKETSGLDCCSSHGSTDIHKEASEFSDLEEESGEISASPYGLERCRERRRETMPLSDVIAESLDLKVPSHGNSSSGSLFNNESKLSASNTTQELEDLEPVVAGDDEDVNSSCGRRRSKKAKIPPSNAELEDFFSVTENDLMRHFTHRYNFDFVKEEPFEGRYEWVPVPVSHDEHVL